MCNKEQSSVQSSLQSKVESSVQYKVQSTVQSTVQDTVQSNNVYVYGVGILAVLFIGVCVFFTFQAKDKKRINHHNDVMSSKYLYNK